MCNCVAMGTKASVLVEIGFMTNKRESELMKTEAFCKEQGEDAARGILDYLGIPVKTTDTGNVINITVSQFLPKHGDNEDFEKIIINLKDAMNKVFGVGLALNSTRDDVLLMHLGNVLLVEGNPYSDLNYVLQQIFVFWGYDTKIDGIFGPGTASTVALFQSQTNIAVTRTTTAEFWKKILGK